MSGRVESEQAHAAARRLEQVEQALDRGRLPRAVAPEEAVATAAPDMQVQPIQRVRPAEPPHQPANVDHAIRVSHGVCRGGATSSSKSSAARQGEELRFGDQQVVGVDDHAVELADQTFDARAFLQWRCRCPDERAATDSGLDDPL